MAATKGDRVRLVRCTDEHTRLRPGVLGTVTLIDSLGTVHVRWDDGHSLGLIPEAGDRFDIVWQPCASGAAVAPRDPAEYDPDAE